MTEKAHNGIEKLGITDQILVLMKDPDGNILRQVREYRSEDQLRIEEEMDSQGKLTTTRHYDHYADGRLREQRIVGYNSDGSQSTSRLFHTYEGDTERIYKVDNGVQELQREMRRDRRGRIIGDHIIRQDPSTSTLETFLYLDQPDGTTRTASRVLDGKGKAVGRSSGLLDERGRVTQLVTFSIFDKGDERAMKSYSYYNGGDREVERQIFAPSGDVSVIKFDYQVQYTETKPSVATTLPQR